MHTDDGRQITTPGSSEDHVFVVRLWLERVSGARHAALWRGRVTCVNTKQEIYVGSMDEAFGVVRTALLAQSDRKDGQTG